MPRAHTPTEIGLQEGWNRQAKTVFRAVLEDVTDVGSPDGVDSRGLRKGKIRLQSPRITSKSSFGPNCSGLTNRLRRLSQRSWIGHLHQADMPLMEPAHGGNEREGARSPPTRHEAPVLFEAGLGSAQHLETHLSDRMPSGRDCGSAMAEINDAMPHEGTSIIDSESPPNGHSRGWSLGLSSRRAMCGGLPSWCRDGRSHRWPCDCRRSPGHTNWPLP